MLRGSGVGCVAALCGYASSFTPLPNTGCPTHPSPHRSNFSATNAGAKRKNWKEVSPRRACVCSCVRACVIRVLQFVKPPPLTQDTNTQPCINVHTHKHHQVRPALEDLPGMSAEAAKKDADQKANAMLRAFVDPTMMALKAVALAGEAEQRHGSLRQYLIINGLVTSG